METSTYVQKPMEFDDFCDFMAQHIADKFNNNNLLSTYMHSIDILSKHNNQLLELESKSNAIENNIMSIKNAIIACRNDSELCDALLVKSNEQSKNLYLNSKRIHLLNLEKTKASDFINAIDRDDEKQLYIIYELIGYQFKNDTPNWPKFKSAYTMFFYKSNA